MVVHPTGSFLYIADRDNHRIVKVNASTGAWVGAIGKISTTGGTCTPAGAASGWCSGGVFGTGTSDGMFSSPTAIAIDSTGTYLYVGDSKRVAKINASTGAFVGSIGNISTTGGTCTPAGAAAGWCTGGVFASSNGDGKYGSIYGLRLNPTDTYLYISDSNHRISKVNISTGAFLGAIGKVLAAGGTCAPAGVPVTNWCTGGTFQSGTTDGAFSLSSGAGGLDVDSAGNIYIADYSNHRIVNISK